MLLREQSAAQYVRMSTDMQVYSIEHQSEAIAAYAARRGLTLIKSYEDAGRSGLHIEGRTGLQELLADVQSGRADFSTILVYDVSRWGRFQDPDEAAHYEFLCKRAGISVHYCAEEFENDGSLTATVLKNIKRAMAGEYSRELSVKTLLGKRKLALLGFSSGGPANYGLRRILVDENGNRKLDLQHGEWKSLQSERVVLVPGPPQETNTVRRVFDLLVEGNLKPLEIARQLNLEGIPSVLGRAWTYNIVKGILTNEKYIGNSVFNRTSRKLNGRWRRNPPKEWLRCEGAIETIVSHERFAQAQIQLAVITRKLTKNEMLDALTALWCCSGNLTSLAVEKSKFTLDPTAYSRQFGSVANAFRLIGFRDRMQLGYNANIRKEMMASIISNVVRRGGTVIANRWNRQLIVNDEFSISLFVSRIRTRLPRVWQFGYVSPVKPDILVAARIEERCGPIADYLILPFMYLPHGSWVTMSASNPVRLDRFRFKTLEPLYAICSRIKIEAPKW